MHFSHSPPTGVLQGTPTTSWTSQSGNVKGLPGPSLMRAILWFLSFSLVYARPENNSQLAEEQFCSSFDTRIVSLGKDTLIEPVVLLGTSTTTTKPPQAPPPDVDVMDAREHEAHRFTTYWDNITWAAVLGLCQHHRLLVVLQWLMLIWFVQLIHWTYLLKHLFFRRVSEMTYLMKRKYHGLSFGINCSEKTRIFYWFLLLVTLYPVDYVAKNVGACLVLVSVSYSLMTDRYLLFPANDEGADLTIQQIRKGRSKKGLKKADVEWLTFLMQSLGVKSKAADGSTIQEGTEEVTVSFDNFITKKLKKTLT